MHKLPLALLLLTCTLTLAEEDQTLSPEILRQLFGVDVTIDKDEDPAPVGDVRERRAANTDGGEICDNFRGREGEGRCVPIAKCHVKADPEWTVDYPSGPGPDVKPCENPTQVCCLFHEIEGGFNA